LNDLPLGFSEYQRKARSTEVFTGSDEKRTVAYLLGLGGEVGSLLAEYKKYLRDGDRHKLFGKGASEEIGDILWYLAAAASSLGIDLEAAARKNLDKTQKRFKHDLGPPPDYDSQFEEAWRLPRQFEAVFSDNDGRARFTVAGKPMGDPLTDNTLDESDYRFHDVFHLSYAAVLGWSPVLRKIWEPRLKRRVPPFDDVQDGGRAIAAEEGISLLVFSVATKHGLYDGVGHVDTWLLDTIGRMVEGYEVQDRSPGEWEQAILSGYAVFRQISSAGGGTVRCDLDARKVTFVRH